MKNGLIMENGELIFYKNGQPYHAGVIKVDGDIYYISSKGRAVKGVHIVHREMGNGILRRGTYTFGEDYKLVKGSFVAPKKYRKKLLKPKRKSSPRKISWKHKAKKALGNKKNLIALGAVAAAIVFFAAASFLIDYFHIAPSVMKDNVASNLKVTVSLPTFEEDVMICSRAAKLEYDGLMVLEDAAETGNPYRPFHFEYHLENASGTLLLSESPELTDPRVYELLEENQFVSIENLKVDTDYYYQVDVAGETYTGSFHTAPGTRFVSIPGLVNTRDIGGYQNLDGKTVKQGLLIRGVELDGLVNDGYFIPEEELEAVQDTFGFTFDLDLRGANIYSGTYISRLGTPHKFYDAPMYGTIFNPNSYNSLRQIFTDLANPNHYPMYLHCTWGRDRTGTVVFLLQGLLNMSEEQMKREYKLTGYTDNSILDNNSMDVIINGLKPFAGDTLQEKIVTFLTTEIGITNAQIESIRNIFLED